MSKRKDVLRKNKSLSLEPEYVQTLELARKSGRRELQTDTAAIKYALVLLSAELKQGVNA